MIDAIIPMKPLALSKRRLAGLLTEHGRQMLVRAMFLDVLGALFGSATVARAHVLTADRGLAALAARHGVGHIAEAAPKGLNAAVSRGARHLAQSGARTMLVIPGDVPFVTTAEIDDLASAASVDAMVIVPAHDRDGTNALVLSPPGAIAPAFGRESFARHVTAAGAAGMTCRIHECAGLGRDIDEADDLDMLMRQMADRRDYDFLGDATAWVSASARHGRERRSA